MKRLVAIRFISVVCLLLAVIMLSLDVMNRKQETNDVHGYFIITMILITSALELVRSELAELRKKLGIKN
jgi:hypothetical protein